MTEHPQYSREGLRLRLILALGVAAGLALLSYYLFPPALRPPDRAESAHEDAARLIIDDARVSEIHVRMVSGLLGVDYKAWAWDYVLDLANQDHPVPPDSRLSLLVEGRFSDQTVATLVVNDDPTTGSRYFGDCVAIAADSETGVTTVLEAPKSNVVDIHGWKLSLRGWGDPSTTIRRVDGAYLWRLREIANLILVYCRDDKDPYLKGSTDYGTVEFPRVAVLLSDQEAFPSYRATQTLVEYPLDLRTVNGSLLEPVFSGTYRLPALEFSGEPDDDNSEEDLDVTTFVKEDGYHEEVDVARWRYPLVATSEETVLGIDLETGSRWTQFQSVSAESRNQRNSIIAGVLLGLIVPMLAYAAKIVRRLISAQEPGDVNE